MDNNVLPLPLAHGQRWQPGHEPAHPALRRVWRDGFVSGYAAARRDVSRRDLLHMLWRSLWTTWRTPVPTQIRSRHAEVPKKL